MNDDTKPISPLRQRMIDDMTLRKLAVGTQVAYIVTVAPRPLLALFVFRGSFFRK